MSGRVGVSFFWGCVCVCDIKFGEFATPPRPKHTLESMEDLGGFLLVGLER